MEAFGMYLLKSAVWLTGFGLIYLLFLRNERYFLLNRIYLVFGLLASALFPIISWHYTVVLPVTLQSVDSVQQLQTLSDYQPLFSTNQFLSLLYSAGVIYLIFRIIKQTSSVLLVIRKSGIQPYQSVKLIRTSDYPVSFSFFSFVFVNPSINDNETKEVVNHEREHIRQMHWIDLVLFEALCMLQWFNPVIWFYGRFIRQNHEYLADQRALQHTTSPAQYRAALLNQMFGGPVIALAHSFNYSLNTKRFNMMKNKIYSPARKLKLLLVLPLIVSVFYVFATPEYLFVDSSTADSALSVIPQKESKSSKDTIIKTTRSFTPPKEFQKSKSADAAKESSDTSKTKLKLEFRTQKDKNKESVDVKVAGKEPLFVVNGVETDHTKFKEIDPSDIQSIDVLKDESSTKAYGEKGKNGVVIIQLKDGKTYRTTTDNKSDNEEVTVTGYGSKQQADSVISISRGIRIRGVGKEPLMVVDGEVREYQTINDIDPESIASVTVLKNKSAGAIYGEKGKDGVLLITLKKGAGSRNGSKIGTTTGLKKYKAAEGTSGSSSFSYSTGTTSTGSGYLYSVNSNVSANADSKVSINTSGDNKHSFNFNSNGEQPLLVLNGKIAVNQDINSIPPDEIESVRVWKGDKIPKKYGDKGKNGVIEVKTKKKK
jgi:TonB-dependent SusC/RagA subfamily outer membrane receptor